MIIKYLISNNFLDNNDFYKFIEGGGGGDMKQPPSLLG